MSTLTGKQLPVIRNHPLLARRRRTLPLCVAAGGGLGIVGVFFALLAWSLTTSAGATTVRIFLQEYKSKLLATVSLQISQHARTTEMLAKGQRLNWEHGVYSLDRKNDTMHSLLGMLRYHDHLVSSSFFATSRGELWGWYSYARNVSDSTSGYYRLCETIDNNFTEYAVDKTGQRLYITRNNASYTAVNDVWYKSTNKTSVAIAQWSRLFVSNNLTWVANTFSIYGLGNDYLGVAGAAIETNLLNQCITNFSNGQSLPVDVYIFEGTTERFVSSSIDNALKFQQQLQLNGNNSIHRSTFKTLSDLSVDQNLSLLKVYLDLTGSSISDFTELTHLRLQSLNNIWYSYTISPRAISLDGSIYAWTIVLVVNEALLINITDANSVTPRIIISLVVLIITGLSIAICYPTSQLLSNLQQDLVRVLNKDVNLSTYRTRQSSISSSSTTTTTIIITIWQQCCKPLRRQKQTGGSSSINTTKITKEIKLSHYPPIPSLNRDNEEEAPVNRIVILGHVIELEQLQFAFHYMIDTFTTILSASIASNYLRPPSPFRASHRKSGTSQSNEEEQQDIN